ncbi:hypothetical protein [Rathayibacter sp. Leaf296]|uniref:hypothetical protein n=1 Tax=Rathayibacter sp. Leaf296 TaxID=1736327 RepID=UPI000702611E|nr:hypothetical protein [Rathayibacter sp. Leaf296]KQQ08039.1 hypothetical protein ASF46_11790 [Rathayibacter sp. Leaf296]
MSNDQLEFAHNPDGSVQRRTIVSGVAWTIPVVAMASAPPAAAASLQPTLEFVNGPYTIAACGTLDDVLIHATTDGITPAPVGTVVTVTVPAGLSLPNGLQTQDFLTDVNGDVVISGITAARSTTGGPVTAVAGTAAAGSSISVVQSGVAKQSINQGVVATWSAVPADAVPVGGGYFLTPGGDLYWQNDLVASGVTSATGEDAGGFPNHGFLMQNGVAKQAGEQVVPANSTWSSIPADAVPVGGVYFLTPGGDLYFGNDVVASGVTSAKGEYTDSGWLGYFIQGPVC